MLACMPASQGKGLTPCARHSQSQTPHQGRRSAEGREDARLVGQVGAGWEGRREEGGCWGVLPAGDRRRCRRGARWWTVAQQAGRSRMAWRGALPAQHASHPPGWWCRCRWAAARRHPRSRRPAGTRAGSLIRPGGCALRGTTRAWASSLAASVEAGALSVCMLRPIRSKWMLRAQLWCYTWGSPCSWWCRRCSSC